MKSTIRAEEALEAISRILNYCEEIDTHLPEEEKSGYKMWNDYVVVRDFISQRLHIESIY